MNDAVAKSLLNQQYVSDAKHNAPIRFLLVKVWLKINQKQYWWAISMSNSRTCFVKVGFYLIYELSDWFDSKVKGKKEICHCCFKQFWIKAFWISSVQKDLVDSVTINHWGLKKGDLRNGQPVAVCTLLTRLHSSYSPSIHCYICPSRIDSVTTI